MKPSLLVEYLDQIPEPLSLQNVHLHKFCCQSHWAFKGNVKLLAIPLRAEWHPNSKGIQVRGEAGLDGKQIYHTSSYEVKHRITGWLRLERASGDHCIQFHALSRINWNRMLKVMCSQVLNTSEDRDSAIIGSLLTLICSDHGFWPWVTLTQIFHFSAGVHLSLVP